MQTLHSYKHVQSQPPECQEPCKSILGAIETLNEYNRDFSGVFPILYINRKAVDEVIQIFARLLISS